MFQSKKDFINSFEFEGTPYYDPIELQDTKMGFSIKRKYPENIKYKPPLKQNGDPDAIAVLWVILTDERNKSDNLIVNIRIATYHLWLANHFDYNDDNPESPTKESVEFSNKTPHPLALQNRDKFSFNQTNNHFLDSRNRVVSGIEMLDSIFNEHCETVHAVLSLELKTKRFFRKLLDYSLMAIIGTLQLILTRVFQNKLDRNGLSELPVSLTLYGYSNLSKEQTEKLDIFGYRTAKETIILFCGIVILLSFLNYKSWLELKYFQHISKDSFLVVTHAIFALACIEYLPRGLFWVLNHVIKFRAAIAFTNINPFTYKTWLKPLFTITVLIIALYIISLC